MKMTCKNPDLLPVWDELQDIFLGNKKFLPERICAKLNKLGYETKYGKGHIRMFIDYKGKRSCITISTTGSDNYAGWQALQSIRRVYEKE